MDIKELFGKILDGDTLNGIAGLTGSSENDVKGVLSSALPALIDGVQGQADDASTAEGFVGALSDHAKVDTGDISSFISGIDLEDGGKIIGHLLGDKADATTAEAAEKAGVEKGKAGSILSAIAPLLMSLLGQTAASGDNASSNNASGIGGLMGSLLGNLDFGSLLGGLFGGGDDAAEAAADGLTEITSTADEGKKKKGGFLSAILGLFKGK